jgi:uncharacterized protein (DUF58 family)
MLGTTLLIVGFLFSNTLVLVPAALMLLYLLSDGISFHRAVRVFKDSINLEDHPSKIELPVGYWFKIETTLNNASSQDFRIVRFSHELPTEFDEQGRAPEWLSLPSHGKLRIENSLKVENSGRFRITASIVVFEIQRRLFRHSLRLPCDVTIITQPLVEKMGPSFDATVLYGLATDTLRRGPGTDLAGIRPSNPMDDFHKIDWKATARTGKLMTWESYLERDPSIVLMIDLSSSIKTTRSSVSARGVLLSELAKLLAMVNLATPIGLILYNERKVIADLQPSLGVERRERILRTLLEQTSLTPSEAPPAYQATRSYDDLTRETHALTALSSEPKSYRERFNSFSRAVLPFYKRLESTYLERLGKQGAFAAFDVICNLPEPVLVISISDGETNSVGLFEGARKAARSNHRVVVALLTEFEETSPFKTALDTQEFGLRVLECAPRELSQRVYAEVLELSRIRSTTISAAR